MLITMRRVKVLNKVKVLKQSCSHGSFLFVVTSGPKTLQMNSANFLLGSFACKTMKGCSKRRT